MKVGAENRTRLIAAVSLMVVALISLLWAFTRTNAPAAPSSTQAQTVPQPVPSASASGRNKAAASPADAIDPTLRLDLLKASEDTEYLGSGRNIFRAQAEPPKIPDVVKTPIVETPVAKGPPPPPPITLKFFGFASRSGESKKIFLSQNDDIFVAAEGDIVKGRYKILRINPNSIEVEDVLNNYRQSVPLTSS